MADDYSSKGRTIAKNTLMLYFRMFFMLLVGLFTSRVVLSALGEQDYGIYNVVGGVVAMFTEGSQISRFVYNFPQNNRYQGTREQTVAKADVPISVPRLYDGIYSKMNKMCFMTLEG